MEQSIDYNHVLQEIVRLGYLEKVRLFEELKVMLAGKKKSRGQKSTSWLGCLSDKTTIHGDIVSPVLDEKEWEVLAD